MGLYFEGQFVSDIASNESAFSIKQFISQKVGVPLADLYITVNGRTVPENVDLPKYQDVRVFTRLVGGKGGFGSMLRAIGAQIEKTTNREACRDLSGRRLRDINEEKRLRKWLDGQADREKDAVERKQKRLERLCAEPKVLSAIDDPVYESERQALPERVSASVDAGWEAASSSVNAGTKRKTEEVKKGKKKAKLWIDAELSECSSGSGTEEEDDSGVEVKPVCSKASPGPATGTDSGNDSDRASEASSKV